MLLVLFFDFSILTSDAFALPLLRDLKWCCCLPIHRHKFTWFLSLDGNYRLSQLVKHCDPNDVPLNKGNAYFVNQDLFRNFLDDHDDLSVHVSHRNSVSNYTHLNSNQGLNVFQTKGSPTTANGKIHKYCVQWGCGEPVRSTQLLPTSGNSEPCEGRVVRILLLGFKILT